MFRWGNRTSHLGRMKNSSYYIAPVGDRTHDLPHTVASNMVKVSHALNHSATEARSREGQLPLNHWLSLTELPALACAKFKFNFKLKLCLALGLCPLWQLRLDRVTELHTNLWCQILASSSGILVFPALCKPFYVYHAAKRDLLQLKTRFMQLQAHQTPACRYWRHRYVRTFCPLRYRIFLNLEPGILYTLLNLVFGQIKHVFKRKVAYFDISLVFILMTVDCGCFRCTESFADGFCIDQKSRTCSIFK